MWKELLNSKHFVLMCASVSVLCFTLTIFTIIGYNQTARAQAGCVPIPTSGTIVGGGMVTGSGQGAACSSHWGVAKCSSLRSLSCPNTSTIQETGADQSNTFYFCIAN